MAGGPAGRSQPPVPPIMTAEPEREAPSGLSAAGIESDDPRRGRSGLWPVVRVLGLALAVAAIGFVVYSAADSWSSLEQAFTNRDFIAALAGGAIGYAVLTLLMGLSWQVLLGAADPRGLGVGEALLVYGQSQVLKYLPTNVLHLVGRWSQARRLGITHRAIAWSTGAELVLVVIAAAVLAAVFAFPLLTEWTGWSSADYVAPAIGSAIAVVILGVGGWYFLRRAAAGVVDTVRLTRSVAAAFTLYVAFFLLTGLLVAGLSAVVGGRSAFDLSTLGIVAAAWIIGFFTPGAPAGIGVREAVLTAGLTLAGEPNAVSIAIGYRLVTLGGDLLVFAFAKLARRAAGSGS
jgi:uncharacterized membrane protein YbhN (UPF0104 family)